MEVVQLRHHTGCKARLVRPIGVDLTSAQCFFQPEFFPQIAGQKKVCYYSEQIAGRSVPIKEPGITTLQLEAGEKGL